MDLVTGYGFVFVGILGVALLGALYTIWYTMRKSSKTDVLLVTHSDGTDYKVEVGFYTKCLFGVRFAILVILTTFLAWNLSEYGQSIYNYYNELQSQSHSTKPQVPCYFIFGDSLVDNGNNNVLKTTARADYSPYGIDYPFGPTGRFSNGHNVVDFIAKYLGFKQPIPPYAYARATAIIKGANYGSGAAGIRNESGEQLGDRLSLDRQLQNHKRVVLLIRTLLGSNAENYLKTCLYSVGMGSNDYINNYLLPEYFNTSKQYNPDEYATLLVEQYSQQLKTLYSYGARKIAVFGLGFIGCIPDLINATGCSTEANTNGLLFESKLTPLLDTLNQNLTDARFTYINVTQISLTPVPDTGLTNGTSACCVVSTTVAAGQCQPNRVPCANRNNYTFFDDFHPSERAVELEAQRAYSALTALDATPYDIKTLAKLQI